MIPGSMSDHAADILRALRGALDALPDVVYCLDEHGAVLYLGAAAERLYGKPVAALLTGTDFRLAHVDPGDRARVSAAYTALEDGRRAELTYSIRRADGGLGTVRERLSRRDGRVQGVITAVRTDAQLALPLVVREALEHGEQLFAMLDWSGRFRWVSGAFESQLGLDRAALLGTHYTELVHPEDRAVARGEEAEDRSAPPSTRYLEVRLGTGDGGWRWVALVVLHWAARGRSYLVGIDVDEAHRAAAALEQAEAARLATYDGLWDVDLITGEISGNARLYAMLGYAEGEIELRYDNWLNLVHPDDRERVGAAFEEHLWGDAPMYQLEHRLLRKDGAARWVLARGQVVLREGGFTPTRMVGAYTDVTERRLVEEALARSEERARCIVDAVTVPMVISRLADGRVLFANEFARQRFGARVEGAGDFYGDTPEGAGFLDRLEQEGRVSEYEASFPAPGGGTLWVIAAASLIDFDGAPAVLATFSDITERRQAEEEIRERNETLQVILRTTSDGIWDWDLRTDAVQYSARWKEMLGFADAPLAERAETWRAMIHPEDRPLAEARLEAHLLGGAPFEHTSRYRHRDGGLRWIVVRGHALRDAAGDPYRVVANHTDITEQIRARDERQRMETRLQGAQRLESMGVMAKGVAHDFNNLLMAMLGNAELARLEVEEDGEARRRLDEICEAARRANELCNQLLAYAGEGDVVLSPIDVGSVVRDMKPLLEASIARRAHIELDCAHDLPAIRADVGRLRQVVANLVLNAADALDGMPGVIRVATGMTDLGLEVREANATMVDPLPAELYVFVEIEDDGDGIDPDIRHRIFDPFFTTRGGAGRGLGLAAALGIMRSHGGTIEVDSAVGEGSRFRLLFPIVREATRVGPLTSAPPPPPPPMVAPDFVGEGEVLVVDDEGVIRELTRRVLERAGFEVSVAADGVEAVQRFGERADRVRAVVLDLTMPHLDGLEVLGRMRRTRPDVPVLLMSGFPDPEAVRDLAGKGPLAFIAKPFGHAQLLARLVHLLGGDETSIDTHPESNPEPA